MADAVALAGPCQFGIRSTKPCPFLRLGLGCTPSPSPALGGSSVDAWLAAGVKLEWLVGDDAWKED